MSSEKKSQFNVYLPAELIRELKHAAIDDESYSMSEYIEGIVRRHLHDRKPKTLELFPVLFHEDVSGLRDFLSALGLEFRQSGKTSDDKWLELTTGSGFIGLHYPKSDAGLPVEMGFATLQPLEDVVERLEAAGIAVESPIVDEVFGRSLIVASPQGVIFYIVERDLELIERQSSKPGSARS